jgi:hypothetical protein
VTPIAALAAGPAAHCRGLAADRLFPRAHVPAILVRLSRFAERDAWEHSDAMARLKKGALCSRQVTIR